MVIGLFVLDNEVGIDVLAAQVLHQGRSEGVIAHLADERDLSTEPGRGHGLIGSFTPGHHFKITPGAYCLAGSG